MYNEEYIGKNVKVLFEEKDGEYYKGHTKNYIQVWSKGEELDNKIVDVEISENRGAYMIGNVNC